MSNIYYKPDEPRRIFKLPLTTKEYVQGVGRCTHCPGLMRYCDECRRELSPFKTFETRQAYEQQVQAGLPTDALIPVAVVRRPVPQADPH